MFLSEQVSSLSRYLLLPVLYNTHAIKPMYHFHTSLRNLYHSTRSTLLSCSCPVRPQDGTNMLPESCALQQNFTEEVFIGVSGTLEKKTKNWTELRLNMMLIDYIACSLRVWG